MKLKLVLETNLNRNQVELSNTDKEMPNLDDTDEELSDNINDQEEIKKELEKDQKQQVEPIVNKLNKHLSTVDQNLDQQQLSDTRSQTKNSELDNEFMQMRSILKGFNEYLWLFSPMYLTICWLLVTIIYKIKQIIFTLGDNNERVWI